MIPVPDFVKKYGLIALAFVAAFALGRYTMRSSVEKEYQSQYQSQLTEQTTKMQADFDQKLKTQQEQFAQQLSEQSKKSQVTDTTTIKKPDGTIIVQQHTKDVESTKQTQKTTDDKTTNESDTKQSTTTVVDNKQQTVTQTVTEKTTTTPPPSWRVYGAAALASPVSKPTVEYGLGAMYDVGPFNVGGFGLYGTTSGQLTVGVTAGISF